MQITYIVSYYVCFPTKPVERERKKGGERGRGAERERAFLIIFNHIAVHQSNCCLVHSTLGVGRIIVTEYSIFHLVITSIQPHSGLRKLKEIIFIKVEFRWRKCIIYTTRWSIER